MKNRTLVVGIAIASLVLASLACGNDLAKAPTQDRPVETKQAFEKTEATSAPVSTDEEVPASAGTRIAPSTTPEGAVAQPTEATPVETPSGVVEEFFKVWSTGVAYNAATAPTLFEIGVAWQVTEILTYHWNEGQGMSSPGTIGLKATDGTMYGPWPATGQDGQGGVPNAAWVVHPNIVIPPGAYTVIDSDPGTWSQNQETQGAGMAWGLGIRQDNP